MKEISAGIIIKCPSGILMCHPTGRSFSDGNYDIPKGHVEENEQFFEACIRELKEETGIVLEDTSKVKDIGLFDYYGSKCLYLFSIVLDKDVDIEKLKCTSTFINKKTGKETLEMNGYVLSDNLDYLYRRLKGVIVNNNIMEKVVE